jgi:hypothetical protein
LWCRLRSAIAIHNSTISGNSVNVNLSFGGGSIESDCPALSINKTIVSGNRGGAGNGVGIKSTSLACIIREKWNDEEFFGERNKVCGQSGI